MNEEINFDEFIPRFDKVLTRGLSQGLGRSDGQMCIEAAVCYALNLPHGDDPGCVARSVREHKIRLNDSNWSSPQARAKGLRNLGIAQLGSRGVVSDEEYYAKFQRKTIKHLIPTLFREAFPTNDQCLKAAAMCESAPVRHNAIAAANCAVDPVNTLRSITDLTTDNSNYSLAVGARQAAKFAAFNGHGAFDAYDTYHTTSDKYLILSANLALEVLKELKSPGCEYI